uniref:Elongation factor 1-gamma n=1 Tax=Phallusia mammillata TaxID=59560 RepID=A0A6F9DC37_9ASCI|nr:elongation factor 1-gamma-A-like [Phallusia mammillata]
MAGKLYAFPNSFQAQKIQIAAAFSGKSVEVADFVVGETNKSAEFLKKFPLGKVPAFEGNEVTLFETNAIAYYVGNDETRGGANEAEVLQWIGVADNEILPLACTWVYPTLGIMQYNKAATEKAKEDIKKVMMLLNNHLLSRTFVVGERITQADISLACTLLMLYVGVFDADFRAAFPNVNRWFTTLINQPQFKSVLGDVQLCTKMAQFDAKKYNEVCGKSAKKEQPPKTKAKEEKKPKKKEVGGGETVALAEAPAKKTDPWANCPEATFNMEEWKRTFSNDSHEVAYQYFLDNFPKENYSVWHCKYMYNDELKINFMSMNLINGMLQRLEKLRKNAFGVMLLLCDDGPPKKLAIEGLWIWLGDELAFKRTPDWQIDYEYFAWEKLDYDNQCTKDTIKKFFKCEGEFNGMECIDSSDYK